MSDPRPTATEDARAFVNGFWGMVEKVALGNGERLVGRLGQFLEARDAASDAREDRLRRALEKIRDGSCDCPEVDAEPEASHFDLFNCHRTVAHVALAAIPPRSDR